MKLRLNGMMGERCLVVTGFAGRNIKLALAVIGLLIAAWLQAPVEAAAFTLPGATITEVPLATGPGDQVNPVVQDGAVIYDDRSLAESGLLVRRLLGGGPGEPVAGPGVTGTPGLDGGFFAWLNLDGTACMKGVGASAEACVALPAPVEALAFSGDKAVTSHGNKVIRLVNFSTGRSRVLDSSTTTGDRYDPDVEGDRAVWVKERGYAGQYYEPLIVDYDLVSDTYSYLTATGGGAATGGGSLYERSNPALDGSDVVYQQRIREPGEQWDIYLAVPETFGLPLVVEAGDQVNPALDSGIVVFQDNRGGYTDGNGDWVGEWDLYLKDLGTGVEMPLCTAAGDQVNPRINGNVIVWQDNRGGDWDIYAAVIDAAGNPAMSVRVDDVFWPDYAAFLARNLTVRYLFSNQGDGAAAAFTLREVDTIPASVTADVMPAPVDSIAPGQTAALEVRYQVPQGVTLFKTALFASCNNGAGAELWFPRQPAGSS